MRRLLIALVACVALLPIVGYVVARSRSTQRLTPEARRALAAPLDVLQQQARALDGAQPDLTRVCSLNSARLRTRVPCDIYASVLRDRLAGFVGATLDVTSMSGDPRRDRLVLLGVAGSGPHGSAEFSVRMIYEDTAWRVADVLRYGRSMLP